MASAPVCVSHSPLITLPLVLKLIFHVLPTNTSQKPMPHWHLCTWWWMEPLRVMTTLSYMPHSFWRPSSLSSAHACTAVTQSPPGCSLHWSARWSPQFYLVVFVWGHNSRVYLYQAIQIIKALWGAGAMYSWLSSHLKCQHPIWMPDGAQLLHFQSSPLLIPWQRSRGQTNCLGPFTYVGGENWNKLVIPSFSLAQSSSLQQSGQLFFFL